MAAVTAAAGLAQKLKVPFVLNPAPAAVLPEDLLQYVHTIVPNETEAKMLTGEADPGRAARVLLEKGCRQVVITLGAQGAMLAGENETLHIPAPVVQPVDTVGAGDCFVGWMALGIARGLPAVSAARQAAAAASLAVTREGAQASMPYRDEVEQLLA